MYSLVRRVVFSISRIVCVSALLVFAMVNSAVAAERMIIVLDGSGSMWGQIDGKPKLEIARETLGEVLKGVDGETELGLIAYGHREKGNCEDIELIVPPAAGTREEIISAVNNLKFLGKTPLSAAVKQAAEELRYTEDRATVILITDGLETCNANVCEVADELESQGVDFTAHVVGFGLSEAQGQKVACLAENTGGRYFQADDAEALVVALKETIAAPLPEVALVAVDQDDQELEDIALDWKLMDANGEVILEDVSKTMVSTALPVGDYKVMVTGEGVSGGTEFSVGEDASQKIEVPVELQNLNATLEAPEQVAAGAEFEVSWTGPGDKRDYITIVETGAKQGKYNSYKYAKDGSPVTLTAPDGLGEYEIRYVLDASKKTLASRKITLTETNATLEAPEEVAGGAEFEVNWAGPDNKRDYITIVEVGAKQGKYNSYKYTKDGSPVTLSAPDGLGEYEIRYVLDGSKRTLISRKIILTEISATLDAPAEVAAGAAFEVNWTGPNNKRDYITIVEVGGKQGKYSSYQYTKKGSPMTLTAPDALGAYEVRYVLDASKRTLISRPVTLTEVSASLTAPDKAVPGGTVTVDWQGPNSKGDLITLVEKGTPEGKYAAYKLTAKGSPVRLKAPKALGKYEIRYLVGQSRRTLTSVDIMLEPASASVSVAGPVKAGGVVRAEWTGPAGENDFIEIVTSDAGSSAKPLVAARTAQGSPISLFAPASAGEYQLRYKMRDSGEVLATGILVVE